MCDSNRALNLVLEEIKWAHPQDWLDYIERCEWREHKTVTGLLRRIQDAMLMNFKNSSNDPDCEEGTPLHVLFSRVLNICPGYHDVAGCKHAISRKWRMLFIGSIGLAIS